MVVDLTYTYKYYDGKSQFEARGTRYLKLLTQGGGHTCPSQQHLELFMREVDALWARFPERPIVVHCTHGINRTGIIPEVVAEVR